MSDLQERLLRVLRLEGVATSATLQESLGASQPTVSRLLQPLLQSGQVLRVGRSRSQSYLVPRAVEGVDPTVSIPVVKVDAEGAVTPFATLIPVVGDRYWVDEEDGPAALHDGLPWFLSDMRPQGFMGRMFARTHEGLGLPSHPEHWRDDDVLRALCLAGEDLPGNLVVAQQSLERYQQIIPGTSREGDYPRMADQALQGGTGGSSAGGDNPKFTTVHEGRHVIVKFSAADDSPAAQRWRDLLVCEHLALQTLLEHGIAAATSRVVEGGGRVFLEVVRFDRTERGRIGMVSLMAYDSEYIGKIDSWANTAERMVHRELMTGRDADRLRLLEAFGMLIGNTDRHYGNISFLIDPAGDWELSPAYDVLPMVYAPYGTELVARAFDPAAIKSTAQTLKQWTEARRLALAYWRTVALDTRISQNFKQLASAHARALGA